LQVKNRNILANVSERCYLYYLITVHKSQLSTIILLLVLGLNSFLKNNFFHRTYSCGCPSWAWRRNENGGSGIMTVNSPGATGPQSLLAATLHYLLTYLITPSVVQWVW